MGRVTNEVLSDFKSWLILIAYLFIIVCIIRPFTIRIPKPARFRKERYNVSEFVDDNIYWLFEFNFGSGPPIGLLFLLITTSIGGDQIKRGIVGDATIQPYGIAILFFTLAFICISIDLTGVFGWVALHTLRKSGTSGIRLYCYFYILVCCLTVVTSNDIVILTVTPITCYFCAHIKADPTPFVITQFVVANCWSITLYIGNATNVIVSQAYGLDFVKYSRWMSLPAVTAGLSAFVVAFPKFYSRIPKVIAPPDLEPSSALKDPKGAVGGLIWLLACFATLVGTSFAGVHVWQVTLPFAGCMFIKNAFLDLKWRGTSAPEDEKENELKNMDEEKNPEADKQAGITATEEETCITRFQKRFQRRMPTIYAALVRLPWKVLPFILSMFIIVESLQMAGWLQIFARGLAAIINGNGVFASVYILAYLAAASCIVLNNIPMTILFSKILQNHAFTSRVSSREHQGCLFGLVLGSNLGAGCALNGALAGLMWVSILKSKGVNNMTYFRFMGLGQSLEVFIIAAASLVLSLEIAYS